MRSLLLAILLFFSMDLLAQQGPRLVVRKPVKDTIALNLDSSKNLVREFDNEAIQKYKTEKEFQYGDEEPKGLNWWQRFWRNFWRWLDRLFGQQESVKSSPSIWPVILKYTTIVICIGLIVFAIFKLAGVDLKFLSRKSKTVDVPYDESLENIHEISFDDEIENTLQSGNYRLAVRLLYLQTLKHLSDSSMIDWLPNKTNLAYVKEVQQNGGFEDFANLTTQFEYIWYGDFNIDKAAFGYIQQSFQQFNERIK
ncbi:MAG: DUF4129 domain-containing protein [Pedobacter sp.]|nr:MAG: DUF4129 domain-containing protein [Pedobacter sp.]